jgi:predicted nucleotidyltransferase
MRTPAPPLLPLLRSAAQGDLLALVYLHPDQEYSLTEAAGLIGASVKTLHHEVNRLADAGYLVTRKRGNLRLVRAETDSVITRPLTELLTVTYGPLHVLTQALTGVVGIEAAYIYGSWAARYEGEYGPVPRDVDVLVVGTADLDDLSEAVLEAQQRLRREVNFHRIPVSSWFAEESSDPFLESVRSRPIVRLNLNISGAAGEGKGR